MIPVRNYTFKIVIEGWFVSRIFTFTAAMLQLAVDADCIAKSGNAINGYYSSVLIILLENPRSKCAKYIMVRPFYFGSVAGFNGKYIFPSLVSTFCDKLVL